MELFKYTRNKAPKIRGEMKLNAVRVFLTPFIYSSLLGIEKCFKIDDVDY